MVAPLIYLLLQQQIGDPGGDAPRPPISGEPAAPPASAAPDTIASPAEPVATQPAPVPAPLPASEPKSTSEPIPSELASPQPMPEPAVPGFAAQQSVRRPGSSLMNPAMSVIMDGTFGYYGRHREDFVAAGLPIAGDDPSLDREGFGLQEVELAFQSAIDPYLEGALFLTIPNLEGIEVEEGYLVTTSLPLNLQIKAGSFRSQIGRNNTQHLHLQNFTRRPLFTSLLFGTDGLRGLGAQASVLLPLPWFATFFAEAFTIGAPDDPTVTATFGGGGRRDPGNLTYAAELEQYWDATDSTSFLLGLNAATGRFHPCEGPNLCPLLVAGSSRSLLTGGDLTVRWKPANVAQTYASVQWTTEFFLRALSGSGQRPTCPTCLALTTPLPTEGAGYSELVVQIARRWYVGGRFDLVGLPSGINLPRRYGYAASLTFAPSEFSRFRVYAQEIAGPGVPSSTVAFFQTEVSLGAHGAHPY